VNEFKGCKLLFTRHSGYQAGKQEGAIWPIAPQFQKVAQVKPKIFRLINPSMYKLKKYKTFVFILMYKTEMLFVSAIISYFGKN